MLGYVADHDRHRHNADAHYRLYLARDRTTGAETPTAVCVQSFDYDDYDPDRFLGHAAYPTDADAQTALRAFLTDCARVLGILPPFLTPPPSVPAPTHDTGGSP